MYVGYTYYITWNPDSFSPNSSITVLINYANTSNTQIWSSPSTPNNVSYTTVTFDKSWLEEDHRYSNMTLIAMEYDPTTSSRSKAYNGPTIALTNAPARHHAPPPHTKAPDRLALMVALPLCLGVVLLVVCGTFIGFRHKRTIGIGNIMGRRNKGYLNRKSRRQRLGLSKKGGIQLREREFSEEDMYRDDPLPEPNRGGHNRDVSLGSLVSTDSDRERKVPGAAYNVFRSDISQTKSWR